MFYHPCCHVVLTMLCSSQNHSLSSNGIQRVSLPIDNRIRKAAQLQSNPKPQPPRSRYCQPFKEDQTRNKTHADRQQHQNTPRQSEKQFLLNPDHTERKSSSKMSQLWYIRPLTTLARSMTIIVAMNFSTTSVSARRKERLKVPQEIAFNVVVF